MATRFLSLSLLALYVNGVIGAEIKITTANELIALSDKVLSGVSYAGTTFYLENDIDFTGATGTFKPIGDASNPFCGTFDGQGHKISNLKMDSTSSRQVGFFGYSQGGIVVRNLVLDDTCSITRTSTNSGGFNTFVGGIIGCCDSNYGRCISENNVNMAAVSFSGKSDNYFYMGGIVGQFCTGDNNHDVIIRNCINYGTVTYSGTTINNCYIGGVVGNITYSKTSTTTKYVQNCINYGTVSSSGSVKDNIPFVGGVIGVSSSPVVVENCVNVGKVTKSSSTDGSHIGSVIGYAFHGSTIKHCYWTEGTGYDRLYGFKYPESDVVSVSDSYKITINAASVNTLNSYRNFNKWVLNTNSASVTFHTNKGNGYKFTSQKLILLPSLVGSSGRTFSGWYTDITCTNKFDESSATINSNSGFNLYGGWKYTVNFNGNSGTPSQSSKGVVYGQNYGPLGSATKTGYTFAGWYTAANGGTEIESNANVTITTAQTLYAHWAANTYTVTFNGNGGTPSKVQVTVAYDSFYDDLGTATKTGYTFLGWFTDISGGTEIKSDTKVEITSTQTLYAHWKANTYTVTFDGNGGTPSQGSKSVTYDEPYEELPDVERIGYTFIGWYTNTSEGNKIETNTRVNIASDHTLYAHWEANIYAVTFDENGGIISPQDTKNVTYDEPYEELPSATKKGYTFLGWFTNITEGDKVESDTNVTTAEDHTLYAQWIINTYTVTFKIDNETVIEEELLFNATIEYPDNISEKEGFIFVGWDKNITTVPDHNITINTLWDEIFEFVEIVFNTKGMTKEDIERIIKEYAGTDFTIVEYEDQSGNEARVIIKFNDRGASKNFVETIKANNPDVVKSVSFISEVVGSLSLIHYPSILISYIL